MVQFAALRGGEKRHLLLLLLGETGQVGILQQVGGMALVVFVRDGHANLVGQCRPFQQVAIGLAQ